MSSQKRKERGPDADDESGHKKRPSRDYNDVSVSEQILETLKTQNNLLRNIDARLGRMERQRQGSPVRQQAPRRNQPPDPVAGSWKFVESQAWKNKSVSDVLESVRVYNSHISWDKQQSYGRPNDEGLVLTGDTFPINDYLPSEPNSGFDSYFPDIYTPNWATDNVRNLLPQLVINSTTELGRDSGVYLLGIKYNEN